MFTFDKGLYEILLFVSVISFTLFFLKKLGNLTNHSFLGLSDAMDFHFNFSYSYYYSVEDRNKAGLDFRF